MTDSLQRICDNYIASRDVVKKTFKLEYSAIYPVCANLFAARGKIADHETLASCKALLKEKTGLFSNFRGTLAAPVSTMMAVSGAPERTLDEAIENYAVLKKHFWGSEYLALVAFLLADMGVSSQVEERAARGKAIYKRMKESHPFLTSQEDSVFAVLMAFSERSDDELVEEMESVYELCKSRFSRSNATQAVSHVLALSPGEAEQKAQRLMDLYDAIKASGGKYGKHFELPTLAALSVLDVPIETLVSELLEVDAFLSQQKGYGMLSVDKKTRMMHAAMLVTDVHEPEAVRSPLSDTALRSAPVASTLALIAAQQAALCAAIVASSSASSAAASSGSH